MMIILSSDITIESTPIKNYCFLLISAETHNESYLCLKARNSLLETDRYDPDKITIFVTREFFYQQ